MKWLGCLVFIFYHYAASTQNDSIYRFIKYDTIYSIPHNYKLAQFPKDRGQLGNYILTHLVYPEDYETGTVELKFVVNLLGEITNVQIVNGVKPSMDQAAIDLVLGMPHWEPGALNFFEGPVVSYRTLSIYFSAKNSVDTSQNLEIYTVVEKKAEFPGGNIALLQYINNGMKSSGNVQEGRVIVSFIIDSNGFVKNVNVIKSISPSMDSAAIKLVESMPQWQPATQRGRPVNIYYTLPIFFETN